MPMPAHPGRASNPRSEERLGASETQGQRFYTICRSPTLCCRHRCNCLFMAQNYWAPPENFIQRMM